MCIRDRYYKDEIDLIQKVEKQGNKKIFVEFSCSSEKDPKCCLLYTSDAADERSSVDLGGRRIIKNKKDVINAQYQ